MAKKPAGIVWLASYPRSGNTWTRQFLNNLFAVLDGKGEVPKDINAITEYTIWDIPAARFEKVMKKPMGQASRADVAAARAMVQTRIKNEAQGPVFVKTHNALVMDRGHPTINMAATAGAIYIVRNPLDVVISFAHHFGIDIDTAVARMGKAGVETDMNEGVAFEVYGSWSENVASWTGKPHRAIFVMRYEDMLGRAHETFAKLARHLLIDATDAQITQAIELASFSNAQKQEAEKGYMERPKTSKAFFREGRAGQWQEVLSPAQIERIRSDHAVQMARFGYGAT